jgi:hypothetical protein
MKRITKAEAESLISALRQNKACILRGAFIQPHFISAIKPITKAWFGADFIEQQSRMSDRSVMQLEPGGTLSE